MLISSTNTRDSYRFEHQPTMVASYLFSEYLEQVESTFYRMACNICAVGEC